MTRAAIRTTITAPKPNMTRSSDAILAVTAGSTPPAESVAGMGGSAGAGFGSGAGGFGAGAG